MDVSGAKTNLPSNWCDLLQDLPPYSTMFWHYKHWRAEGVIEEIMTILHGKVREQAQNIIDSQAVKNTCNASEDNKATVYSQALTTLDFAENKLKQLK